MNYAKVAMSKQVSIPQTVKANPRQVMNNAGGYVYTVSTMQHLRRFLILGTEGGTYYSDQKEHTVQAVESVTKALHEKGKDVIDLLVQVRNEGLAPKQGPTLLAFAMALGFNNLNVRLYAERHYNDIIRTGTDQLTLVSYLKTLGINGTVSRRAVANWYASKSIADVVYQTTKYANREGFTHRDVLRLVHPKATNKTQNDLYGWLANKRELDDLTSSEFSLLHIIEDVKQAHAVGNINRCIQLIIDNRLTREFIPNELLTLPEVWTAMLPTLPMTATLRNLGNMSRIGVFDDPRNVRIVVNDKFTEENVRKAKMHPYNLLNGWRTYTGGAGFRSSNTWDANRDISYALEQSFYNSFLNVPTTGKRFLFGLDVSGSMNTPIQNSSLTCREGALAMAMASIRNEIDVSVLGFSRGFTALNIKNDTTLDQALKVTNALPFQSTDCSLPMVHALQHRIPVDVFAIYTDNETYAGRIHPDQALREYRQKMGIDAKLVVVGMTATSFTIADPRDFGMMDVVGFDSSAPAAIGEFAQG